MDGRPESRASSTPKASTPLAASVCGWSKYGVRPPSFILNARTVNRPVWGRISFYINVKERRGSTTLNKHDLVILNEWESPSVFAEPADGSFMLAVAM